MMIKSALRPVSTPPPEVASRQPCAVVSNSGIPARPNPFDSKDRVRFEVVSLLLLPWFTPTWSVSDWAAVNVRYGKSQTGPTKNHCRNRSGQG